MSSEANSGAATLACATLVAVGSLAGVPVGASVFAGAPGALVRVLSIFERAGVNRSEWDTAYRDPDYLANLDRVWGVTQPSNRANAWPRFAAGPSRSGSRPLRK